MSSTPTSPRILTTTVGSYPVPYWLRRSPSEQALRDATRVVIGLQRQAGIDLPTDGELYRFDPNHPETNGMIDYFIRPMGGIRTAITRSEKEAFKEKAAMGFRIRPAGVVDEKVTEGTLDLVEDWERLKAVAGRDVKFTVTSPYMVARTLLDRHYGAFEKLLFDIADTLAAQIAKLDCRCVQIDEANITGNSSDGTLAAKAINRVLDAVQGEKAVHFCFGNYGGQTIQQGRWQELVSFLNGLKADHLVLELAHRPESDLDALKEINPQIGIGVGVVDVKVNHVETAEEIARRLERAEMALGEGRVRWAHPDCGFWMLKRSVADRKIEALAKGRDLYLSR